MAITTSWLSSTWCMYYIEYEAQRVPLTVIDNIVALLTLRGCDNCIPGSRLVDSHKSATFPNPGRDHACDTNSSDCSIREKNKEAL